MSNLKGFNAQEVEPQSDFEPIPAGDYTAMIVESEMKPTKNGNGEYLQLVFEVCDGQYQSRKIFARLNLNNPNQTAVDIAQRELSAICHAVGVLTPDDSMDLHDKPMTVKVKIRQSPGYDPQNEIAAYKPLSGGGSSKPAASASGAPRKPWEK
jgi:hypothetical protein